MPLTTDSNAPEEVPTTSVRPVVRTVMIVEPQPDQQWKLARMFTVQGYRVIGSASLHAASVLLRRFPVDLILLAADGVDDDAERAVTELAGAHPDMRFLIMGDKEPQTTTNARTGIQWIRRPARMQDLAAFDAAVA